MIKLLPVHLVNPGTDRVMCTTMRKNCNYTTQPAMMTCAKCQDHYLRNVEWYWQKLEKDEHSAWVELWPDVLNVPKPKPIIVNNGPVPDWVKE